MIKIIIILSTIVMTVRSVPGGYGFNSRTSSPTFALSTSIATPMFNVAPTTMSLPMTMLTSLPTTMAHSAPMMTFASTTPNCMMAASPTPMTFASPQPMAVMAAPTTSLLANPQPTTTTILVTPFTFNGKPMRFNSFRGGQY